MLDPFVKNPSGFGLDCSIEDKFILELKDALLYRTIKYKNNSNLSKPILLGPKEIIYPYHCDDFYLIIGDQKFEVFPVQEDYSRKVKIKLPIDKLEHLQEFQFTILCRWRDFYNFLANLHFSFRYNDVAKYKLVIKNYSLSHIKYILEIDGCEAIKNTDYYVTNDEIIISEKTIGLNKEICVKLMTISTPLKLGILEANKEKEKNKNLFLKHTIIVIQHLLSDAVHLIEAFEDLGAKKEAIFIVGIPYSTKHQTVNYLKKKGFKNISTPNKYPFEDSVRECMSAAIEYAKRENKSIVVVEDGGYVVPLLHSEFVKDSGLFLGAIEQTANGIWRDKKIESPICCPVINVAESTIKQRLEPPLIGRSVSKNIELIINKTYHSLEGIKIGIVGYGNIGSAIAKNLKSNGSIVTIYDKKSINRTSAKNDGFEVKDTIFELVKDRKIIIESTGEPWFPNVKDYKTLIPDFNHGCYFVSASSKRMGLDYSEFNKWIEPDLTTNIPGLGVRYILRTDPPREITLVADGYPINFFLGESVPDFDIAFILAWLFKCAQILVEKQKVLPKGIIDTNEDSDKWGFLAAQNSITEDHDHGLS